MVKNLLAMRETLESPLGCKEIQPVHPKGNQSWIFIGGTDAEAEAQILWPPDAENWLIGKYPDAGGRLKAGGEGDNKGWDVWMASPTQPTWVWASSRRWWWAGKPGVLQVHGTPKSRTELSAWTNHKTVHICQLPKFLRSWYICCLHFLILIHSLPFWNIASSFNTLFHWRLLVPH